MPFDLGSAKPVSGGFNLATAKPVVQQSTDNPGIISSVGAGLGKGFGTTVLNLQEYAGKGLKAIGADAAGGWLVSDAEKGKQKLASELAPYKEANPISTGAGELGGEVIATLPVGSVLGKLASPLVKVAPSMAPVAESMASGGFRLGQNTLNPLAATLVRAAGGAVNGGVTAALVNPGDTEKGAVIGAALPGAVKVAGMAGNKLVSMMDDGANKLMQSAIKPTIKQLKTGEAQTAIDTLLQYGISPNAKGVEKLRGMIDDIDTQIADKVANSSATIYKSKVVNRLADVRKAFGSQVSPTADLNAIQGVADDFLSHPNYPGASIPVQAAQEMKQGTYKVLSKKYGQLGGAETEAQKGLARGLKEEIANAIPEISGLNAQESKLITTLGVAERRALMDLNKNPVGLSALASNPLAAATFFADRSPAFKALAARMINASAGGVRSASPSLENAMQNPLLRNAAELSAYRSE